MILYPDQQELINRTRSAMATSKSVLMVSPTGSGKTAMALSMIKSAQGKGKRILFSTPRKDLLEQTSETFKKMNVEHSYVASGKSYNPYAQVYIGMLPSMDRRVDRLPPVDLLIVDECFTSDTMISTPSGEKPIAKMRLGDIVYNATGKGEIVAISRKMANIIYKVALSNGKEIRCTGNHPFFTKHGWIECRKLAKGDELVDIQNMPILWRSFQTPRKNAEKNREKESTVQKGIYASQILLNILLKEDRKCDVGRRSKRKNASNTKKDRTQAIASWWERQRTNFAAKDDDGNAGEWVASGACNKNSCGTQKRDLPELLQSGLREHGKEDCCGGRRSFSQWEKKKIRCEKRLVPNITRVESVEIYEQGGGIDVFNLQVNGHPSYFANGILVHNCHYGKGAMDRVIESYKQAGTYCLGLSASPWKLSGEGLGRWYDTMVEGKSIRWLIDNKRLSDFRYFYGRTKPDLSKIGVTAGDYAKAQLSSYMEEQGAIIGDCVTDYQLRCMGNIHVVRCASIKHSQMTAQAFRDAGIAAMHVDGDTPSDERRSIFKALARREIFVITFVDLLGFGFDLSQSAQINVCIESLSDLKPSKSLAGMLQYWGRALRMKDKAAIIHDHVNNHIEHGFPDDERVWTLDDREQGKRGSSERSSPVAQCKNCFYAFRPAPLCPNCGTAVIIKAREIDQVAGELHEMTREERESLKQKQVIDRKREQAMAKTLPDLIALGKARGMANPRGWALNIIKARGR